MKSLYIRFFAHRTLVIPINSYVVYNPERDKEPMAKHIADTANPINVWMTAYPEGKVEFVWA